MHREPGVVKEPYSDSYFSFGLTSMLRGGVEAENFRGLICCHPEQGGNTLTESLNSHIDMAAIKYFPHPLQGGKLHPGAFCEKEGKKAGTKETPR